MEKKTSSRFLSVVIVILISILLLQSCKDSIVTPGIPEIPSAPTLLSGQVLSSSSVSLSWKDNADNETGYLIEWGTSADSYNESKLVNENTISNTLSDLNPQTLYYFRVRAVNVSEYSGFSNIISLTTESTGSAAVAAPSNVSVNTLSSSSVQINWTDNSNNEEGFEIYRSIDSLDIEDFSLAGTVGENITSFTDIGLPAAKNIFYFVISYAGTALSDATELLCAVTDSIASVPVPTDVTASNGTEAYEILISWTWSEGASSYKVYGSDSTAGVFLLLGETGNENVSIIANDTVHYFYKVTAVDSNGNESNRSSADEGWAITPPVLFEDNFESGLSDWYGSPDTFLSNYDTDKLLWGPGANGTSWCFRLDGGYLGSIANGHYAYKWLSANYQPSYMQVYVKASSTYEEGGEIVGPDSSGVPNFWIFFSNDGYLKLWGSSGEVIARSYSSNTWYRLQLKDIDWTAKTYDFYVNGVLEVVNMKFANSSSTGINYIKLWNDEAGSDFFFDEFFIW